jgi:hypothetical protein
MGSVRTSILGRPRRLFGDRRAGHQHSSPTPCFVKRFPNGCQPLLGFCVQGMAGWPFLHCSMMGRCSSRSMSFVLRRPS